jgi:acetyl esterase/lipase
MRHGSGPETRASFDGELGFLADRFARAGFVVLTYDKRGTGTSGGTYVDDNYDTLSTDAAAAIARLRMHPAVDSHHIGVWGVSQGGQLAPIVAVKAGSVAFVVNLSGSVVNSNDQEIQRTGLQLQADGFDAADVHDAVAFQRLKFGYACTRKDWQTYADAVARFWGKAWYPDPYVGPPEKPDSPAFDFWRCGVEPGLAWERVKVPALMVVAEHETYSDPAANIARFEVAMKRAGNRHYRVLRVPGAEHSLKAARTGGLRELPLLDHYVMSAFDQMAEWMRAEVGLRN